MEIIMKENQYQKSERLLKKWFDSDDAKIYFEKERKNKSLSSNVLLVLKSGWKIMILKH
ncbi:MAG: hypothetical protein WC428_01220 [Candidatus Paceibacterota bacterium]